MNNSRRRNTENKEDEKQALSHNGNYPPTMISNTTIELASKAIELGLTTKDNPEKNLDIMFALNKERYMKHLQDVEMDGLKLQIIPEQTKEMCLKALYNNVDAFKHIKEQDEELCEYALQRNVALIGYVHNQTPNQIEYVLSSNPNLINQIHSDKRNDYHNFIVQRNWENLVYIDFQDYKEEHKESYYELVKCALDDCGEPNIKINYCSPMQCVNDKNKTKELCDYAIGVHIKNIQYVPEELCEKKDIIKFITKYPWCFRSIGNKFQTDLDIILLALEHGYNKAVNRVRDVKDIKYSYSLIEKLVRLSSIKIKTDQHTREHPILWLDMKRSLGTPNIMQRMKTIKNLFPNDHSVDLDYFDKDRQTNKVIKYLLNKNPNCYSYIKSKSKRIKFWLRYVLVSWKKEIESNRKYAASRAEIKAVEDELENL